MAIDYSYYDKLMESGWVIDTAIGSGKVPLWGKFTLVLKEGAPEEIKQEFEAWRKAEEWEREHVKQYGKIRRI